MNDTEQKAGKRIVAYSLTIIVFAVNAAVVYLDFLTP
jgi:hypothetical protein